MLASACSTQPPDSGAAGDQIEQDLPASSRPDSEQPVVERPATERERTAIGLVEPRDRAGGATGLDQPPNDAQVGGERPPPETAAVEPAGDPSPLVEPDDGPRADQVELTEADSVACAIVEIAGDAAVDGDLDLLDSQRRRLAEHLDTSGATPLVGAATSALGDETRVASMDSGQLKALTSGLDAVLERCLLSGYEA
jgi:hypothetical protein